MNKRKIKKICPECGLRIENEGASYCRDCGFSLGGKPVPLDGRYNIISLVGSGGMSQVYKAEQIASGKIVAIKVMDDGRFKTDGEKESARLRFEKEAHIIRNLKHPGIPEVFDFFSKKESYTQAYSSGKTVTQQKTECCLVMSYPWRDF
jgi:serine/threonine protein kinase